MIFQFFNLLDDMTVMDDVLLPAQLADVRSGAVRARAEELLVTLRNGHPRDAYPAWLTMRAAARGGDADEQIGPALDRTGLTQRADDNVSASQPLGRAQ